MAMCLEQFEPVYSFYMFLHKPSFIQLFVSYLCWFFVKNKFHWLLMVIMMVYDNCLFLLVFVVLFFYIFLVEPAHFPWPLATPPHPPAPPGARAAPSSGRRRRRRRR